jgi:hypothetical protein
MLRDLTSPTFFEICENQLDLKLEVSPDLTWGAWTFSVMRGPGEGYKLLVTDQAPSREEAVETVASLLHRFDPILRERIIRDLMEKRCARTWEYVWTTPSLVA